MQDVSVLVRGAHAPVQDIVEVVRRAHVPVHSLFVIRRKGDAEDADSADGRRLFIH